MRALVAIACLVVAVGTARAEHKCERPGDGFAGVTVVGGFAFDLGCRWQAYLLDGQKHPLMDAGALLSRHGWGADGGKRAEAALKFVRGVMLEPGSLLDHPPEGFPGKFSAPRANATDDGGAVVVVWRALPSGMRPGRRYERTEVYFGSDGNIKNVRILDEVTQK